MPKDYDKINDLSDVLKKNRQALEGKVNKPPMKKGVIAGGGAALAGLGGLAVLSHKKKKKDPDDGLPKVAGSFSPFIRHNEPENKHKEERPTMNEQKSLTKLAHDYSEGLSKQANPQQVFQRIQRKLDAEKTLNPQELKDLIGKLREKGYKGQFEELPEELWHMSHYRNSNMQPGKFNLPRFRAASDDGYFQAAPKESLILHEAGHAMDKALGRDAQINTGLTLGAAATAGLGGLAAPSVAAVRTEDEEQKERNANLAALGAAGGGAGLGFLGGKLIERTEDRANNFVKDFLTEQAGGDRKKAMQKFNNSALPDARKNYSTNTKGRAIGHGIQGLMAGALGLGLASKFTPDKTEDEA